MHHEFTPKQIARFWSRVDRSGGDDSCWLWTGGKFTDGYGAYGVGPRRAHRVAWQLTHGPIASGLVICHHCDNPPCCNPRHLFAGTVQDNHADRSAKMRMPHGEGHPSARLTAADVITMRQRYADGGVTQRELSSEYGVTQAHVDKIIRRKKWPYLP